MNDEMQRQRSKLHAGRAGGVVRALVDGSGMRIAPVPTAEAASVQAFVGSAVEDSRAPATEQAEPLIEDERDLEVEARAKKLKDVLVEHREGARALERGQIVEVLVRYARDCGERADELVANARTAVRQQKVIDSATERRMLEQAESRRAAFRVRQAIITDLANKVAYGWGRNSDGSAQ